MKRISVLLLTLVAILCFVSCSTQGAGVVDESAPSGMKLASGQGAYFKMYVPQDWVIDASTATPCAYVSELDRTNISAIRVATAAADAAAYWQEYADEFSKSFTNYTIVTDGENATLSGNDAKKYVYTATLTGVEYKYCSVVCVRDGSAYILTYTSSPDLYDKNYESFTSVCNNFMIKTGSVEK